MATARNYLLVYLQARKCKVKTAILSVEFVSPVLKIKALWLIGPDKIGTLRDESDDLWSGLEERNSISETFVWIFSW